MKKILISILIISLFTISASFAISDNITTNETNISDLNNTQNQTIINDNNTYNYMIT